jgi:hypothetical protein
MMVTGLTMWLRRHKRRERGAASPARAAAGD